MDQVTQLNFGAVREGRTTSPHGAQKLELALMLAQPRGNRSQLRMSWWKFAFEGSELDILLDSANWVLVCLLSWCLHVPGASRPTNLVEMSSWNPQPNSFRLPEQHHTWTEAIGPELSIGNEDWKVNEASTRKSCDLQCRLSGCCLSPI